MSLSASRFNRICKLFTTNNILFSPNITTDITGPRNISRNIILNSTVSFNLSDIGEGIREVSVKEWFVNVGDKVSQFDNICEVQSDKASVTITSRYDGVIKKLYHDIDGTALVGAPLVDIEVDEESSTEHSNSNKHSNVFEEPITSLSSSTEVNNSTLCIPSVRRLSKEYKINLTDVKGTGKNGRILKEDVLGFLNLKEENVTDSMPVDSKNVNMADDNVDRIEPIRGFQKAMVRTMEKSLAIPHFLYSDEIKISKLKELRKILKSAPDVHLSFMPFFIKAASKGLSSYPVLNSSLDDDCKNVIYKGSHNIGIAMDTKVGLAVPIIKNVQKLGILDIAKELNRLMKQGKEGNFTTEDLKGGTFTISNIGVIGGTYTKPVIMSPQVAIVALGAVKMVPRFDENMKIYPEEIINISGAGDHRIIDGATMAHFTNILKKYIENPSLLLLEA